MRFDVSIGSSVSSTAAEIHQLLADSSERKGYAIFNGIPLVVDKGSSPESAVYRWRLLMKRSGREWRRSPRGRNVRREWAESRRESISEAKALIKELPSVDFGDLETALNFIVRCVDPLGYHWNSKLGPLVSDRLRDFGYEAGVNVGESFDGRDRENFARYVIGQAMEGLDSSGSPHPVTERFVKQWKALFGGEA